MGKSVKKALLLMFLFKMVRIKRSQMFELMALLNIALYTSLASVN